MVSLLISGGGDESREGLEGCFGGEWARHEMSWIRMEKKKEGDGLSS